MTQLSDVLALALSTLETMGLMIYIKAMIAIMLVGGFLAVIFKNR